MNKVYGIVWNPSTQAWQVVTELATGRRKGSTRQKRLQTLLLGFFTLLSGQVLALDLPAGGKITAGQGSISSASNTMTINQASSKLAIDWQSFSIGSQNKVDFVQPTANSIALNRVLGSDVSTIQGALSANGQVFLVNPNGVLFTPTAQVNVGGLVSSTLELSNAQLLSGQYRFSGSSANAIINQGNIQSPGGTVALIAAKVENTGNISANKGQVLMGAGSD
jgi:filamentous hemagglutinin family protein